MGQFHFPALRDTLIASLQAGAQRASASSSGVKQTAHFEPRIDRSYIDIQMVVSEFKLRWLYSAKETYALDPTAASGSHLLVFLKNLSVSNVPDAEVLALIRRYASVRIGTATVSDRQGVVDFLSDEQYSAYLTATIRSLLSTEPPSDIENYIQTVAALIVKTHGPILERTISLDRLYTSVLVHIPRSLAVNMRAVVAYSGYIQSSGYSLYARRSEKADKTDLFNNIREFLQAHQGGRIYLAPFAREYFERDQSEDPSISLRNGLDGIQFSMRRQQIGGFSLADTLNDMRNEFKNTLYVAEGYGDYREERKTADVDPNWTLFLIYDNRLVLTEERSYARSVSNLLMLYAQYQANGSQLILFKERKPGWYGPVTLPHTLSAGLLNAVIAQLPPDRSCPLILDPFCGTGTTLMDAAIRLPDARIVGLDRNKAMPAVVRDNLRFFSLDFDELTHLESQLLYLLNQINKGPERDSRPKWKLTQSVRSKTTVMRSMPRRSAATLESDFEKAVEICLDELDSSIDAASDPRMGRSLDEVLEYGFGERTCEFLNSTSSTLAGNVVFYLVWRAAAGTGSTTSWNSSDLYCEVIKELQRFTHELGHLCQHRSTDPLGKLGAFSLYGGLYSSQSIIDPLAIKNHCSSFVDVPEDQVGPGMARPGQIAVAAVTDSLKHLINFTNAVDILIGDPPYWFNTRMAGIDEAQSFYAELIKVAVEALAPMGQLVLPILQYSRNGRQVPFFQTRGSLTRQVLAAVESSGRRAVRVVSPDPGYGVNLNPPFYWNSSSVLSRRVLWFTIS